MKKSEWASALTFLFVVGAIIFGGIFQIVGFAPLYRFATIAVVTILVAAPPIGAVVYAVYLIRKKLKP